MKRIHRLKTPNLGVRYLVEVTTNPALSFWVEDNIEVLFAALHEDEVVIDCELEPDKVDKSTALLPVEPGKIICVGLNYEHHAKEMGKAVPEEPLIFMKPPSAALAHGGIIELPSQSEMVHHEAELAIVMGARAKRIEREEALGVILGYTCANDVTARDIQRREKRYTRGKGFDTFCPLGPVMVDAVDFNPSEATVTCRVNGDVRQHAQMNDLIFSIEHVVHFISHIMTLNPGDVILTGTPMGVGELHDGDEVEVEIEGIGVLRNGVRAL